MKKMWIVTLAAPTVVAEVLRQPVEGSLTVPEEEAERLFTNGKLVGEPIPADGSDDELDVDDEENDGLDAMKIPDLHILVTKEGVPLHDAKKKNDIIAAIRKHRSGGDKPDYERDSLKDVEIEKATKDQLLVIAAYEQADVPQGDGTSEAELIAAIEAKRKPA